MAEETPAVLVRGLVKSYGSVRAVRGIDLAIGHGEIFALLGLLLGIRFFSWEPRQG